MSKDLVTSDGYDSGKGQFLVYEAEDGRVKIDVRLEDETVWLTQKLMADLFQVTVPTINEHIKNIFDEGELIPDATIRKFRIVQKEGKRNVTGMTAAKIIHERFEEKDKSSPCTRATGCNRKKRRLSFPLSCINNLMRPISSKPSSKESGVPCIWQIKN